MIVLCNERQEEMAENLRKEVEALSAAVSEKKQEIASRREELSRLEQEETQLEKRLAERKREAKLAEEKEQHRREILERTEAAKKREQYETYDSHLSAADAAVRVFTARKRGGSHVIKKEPCQDYCASAEGIACTILTDSDGVGSCKHSDVGSRLACEAAIRSVREAEKHNPEEERFVQFLQSLKFRRNLVNMWVRMVMEELSRQQIAPADRLEAFEQYGATLMYAVITKNWIVTGNVGDGQIMVCNEKDGFKLRVHAPKESSKVRCLAHAVCAEDDFQVCAYPRAQFDAVLLTSDGMYESMPNGKLMHQYVRQLKNRFCALPEPEPLQPFCVQEKGEELKDFSYYRTQDDVSIAMAVISQPESPFSAACSRVLRGRFDDSMPLRWGDEAATYFALKGQNFFEVVVSREPILEKLPPLQSAELCVPEQVWTAEGLHFAAFRWKVRNTVELMYSNGQLRFRTSVPESGVEILAIYRKLSALRRELAEHALALNGSAHFLLSVEDGKLLLMPQALRPAESGSADSVERYFANLLGCLSCGENSKPLFGSGYLNRGVMLSRLDAPGRLGYVMESQKEPPALMNATDQVWTADPDGKTVSPRETIPLRSGQRFTIPAPGEEAPAEYLFEGRELL